jgi:hypothetical protein
MHENCDTCHADYPVAPANARLHLFLEDARANHVEATCTSCGVTEVIFTTPAGFIRLLTECKLSIVVHIHPDSALRERADRAWANATDEEEDTPPLPEQRSLPEYDLTARHEQELSGFAASIAAIPDELFWTCIEDDTNHDRPETWT